MWRIYYFDQHMTLIDYEDRLTTNKPHRYAAHKASALGYYTYAIGALS